VVERFQVPAQEKNLSLTLTEKLDQHGGMVVGTVDGLDRVFNNLISNAVKYTPEGGRVTVTLSQKEKTLQVGVADTGIGIPEDGISRLFEEFYRAPNAKEMDREGTGLGLTIVRDIVNRYGGNIQVESQVGKGTCFTVTLPAVN
jgi:two-component system sensor histidine kinase VicK